MKILLIIGGIFYLSGFGSQTLSIPPTNFAGSWIRDKNKVEGMKTPLPELTWIITQDDNQLSVESVGSSTSTSKEIYKLDGTKTITESTHSHPPRKVTRSAKWLSHGKMLELTMESVSRGDTVTKPIILIVKDKLELSEDGKVLRVHRTAEGQQEAISFNFQEIRFTFYNKI